MSSISKYSPELKDIIERPQSRLGLLVYCFLFAFITLILISGFVIESPDIVIAEAKVSSSNPPVVLKSKSVGRIRLIVDTLPTVVDSGQYLAVIDNAADYLDVITLKNRFERYSLYHIISGTGLDSEMRLGELSSSYYAFKNVAIKYMHLTDVNNDYNRQISLLSGKINYDTKELESIKKSYYNSINQYGIKEKQHQEDSILFMNKAITESQYNESRLNILNSQKYLISGQAEIIAKEKSINENQQQIDILSKEYTEVLESCHNDLETRYNELFAQIMVWEDRYVLRSPSHCLVEWASIISEGDYIEIGEPIFNCIFSNNNAHAVALLQGQMSGKVKVGQKVNIKLESFPYTEYGMLEGTVERISMNSIERGYLLYISLPNGFISSTGHELSFAETIYGQAEIITDERRLITRVYHHVYELITSRRKVRLHEEDSNREVLNNKF